MALKTVTLTSGTSWTVPSTAYILDVFLIGGGGAGGSNGGGGGAGGRVTRSANYLVTPGSAVAYAIGAGGAANSGTGGTTTFGSLSAAGGTGGTSNDSSGGSSSRNIYGTTASTSGGTGAVGSGGGGGASPAGNGANATTALPGTGAVGYNFNGTFYGGGGGGGCKGFDQNTVRPIPGAPGGAGGGGSGGGEGIQGIPGTANTGGGGGGGGHSGTNTTRGVLGSYNNSPAAPYGTVAAQNGGAGGTGLIVIRYDDAECVLTTNQPGVAEGDSIVVYLKTKNIPNGAVLGYTMSGSGILSNDFSPASLTGSFTVSSTDGGITGTAQVTITVATDAGVTEGEDTVTFALNNGLGSTQFKIGDLYQFPVTTTIDGPGYLVVGRSYKIISAGTTDFTLLGSANNTAGTTFTATGTGRFNGTELIVGKTYIIDVPGNTDFTKLGAANNNAGTSFTASGTGVLSATSIVSGSKYAIASLGSTDFTTLGAGWVYAGNFVIGSTYVIKFVGTTDFTTIGASSNTVGTVFVATNTGSSLTTGAATLSTYTPSTGEVFQATASGTGTGQVYPAVTVGIQHQIGTVLLGNGTVNGTWVSKTIQVADFNNIQTKVANILGSGSGAIGYGQTVLSNQVTTSNKVSVSDWNYLKYDIINAYYHQTGNIPASLASISIGDTVKANTSTSPYRQFDTWADVVIAQKFDIASSQAITRTAPAGGGNWFTEVAFPGTLGTTWTSRLYLVVNVYWGSAAAARYFFNSGGEIRFNASRTGGTSTGAMAAQNTAWTTLLTGAGTQAFGGNKPVLDTGTLNGGNFYRLSNGFNTWYTTSATSPYSSNTYRIQARTPGIIDNSAGVASSIEFLIEFIDNHVASGGSWDGTDGTYRVTMSTLEASGVLQPAGTGTFSVASPTIMFGTFGTS